MARNVKGEGRREKAEGKREKFSLLPFPFSLDERSTSRCA
jgi:hypothetical protein